MCLYFLKKFLTPFCLFEIVGNRARAQDHQGPRRHEQQEISPRQARLPRSPQVRKPSSYSCWQTRSNIVCPPRLMKCASPVRYVPHAVFKLLENMPMPWEQVRCCHHFLITNKCPLIPYFSMHTLRPPPHPLFPIPGPQRESALPHHRSHLICERDPLGD
jgi:hypothetical protein